MLISPYIHDIRAIHLLELFMIPFVDFITDG